MTVRVWEPRWNRHAGSRFSVKCLICSPTCCRVRCSSVQRPPPPSQGGSLCLLQGAGIQGLRASSAVPPAVCPSSGGTPVLECLRPVRVTQSALFLGVPTASRRVSSDISKTTATQLSACQIGSSSSCCLYFPLSCGYRNFFFVGVAAREVPLFI